MTFGKPVTLNFKDAKKMCALQQDVIDKAKAWYTFPTKFSALIEAIEKLEAFEKKSNQK